MVIIIKDHTHVQTGMCTCHSEPRSSKWGPAVRKASPPRGSMPGCALWQPAAGGLNKRQVGCEEDKRALAGAPGDDPEEGEEGGAQEPSSIGRTAVCAPRGTGDLDAKRAAD